VWKRGSTVSSKQGTGHSVEVTLGPHAARVGWEILRLTYDPANPGHRAQIDAAIGAMLAARAATCADSLPSCAQKSGSPQDVGAEGAHVEGLRSSLERAKVTP
jgi:hypothetical protein